MKIAFLDLETSGLDADGWNLVLCGALAEYQAPRWRGTQLVRPPWSRVVCVTRDPHEPLWEDERVVRGLIDLIQQYDVIVSWNGLKFDEPFLATRAREYGIEAPPWPRHKDLLYTARYKLRVSSASLENVTRLLHIPERYHVTKTPLDRRLWRQAIRGHPQAYRYVVQHCRQDVRCLAAVWEELKTLVREIK